MLGVVSTNSWVCIEQMCDGRNYDECQGGGGPSLEEVRPSLRGFEQPSCGHWQNLGLFDQMQSGFGRSWVRTIIHGACATAAIGHVVLLPRPFTRKGGGGAMV